LEEDDPMDDGVERIIAKIRDDVQWKVEEFQREADAKIEKIRKEEYARWEREKEKIEADGKREAEGIRSLIISRAHLEGKRELMEAREEVMEKVIERIKSDARKSEGYARYLEKKIEEAKGVFGEEFIVVCIPEDKATVDSLVQRIAPGAKVEMGPVKHGGIIVKDVQGTRTVDYSIEALVDRKVNEIRKRIVEKLFEGEYA
jgi:V/A-type H+-transporting ATPase subunit E